MARLKDLVFKVFWTDNRDLRIINVMTVLPVALICGLVSLLVCQGWKILCSLFSDRTFRFADIFRSGGMPSTHTAFSASVAFAAGFREGFYSSLFAVAAVFAFIVAYDAVRVRGTMNTMIEILRKTVPSEILEESDALPDSVGHSFAEVIAGFCVAAVVAVGLHFLLP